MKPISTQERLILNALVAEGKLPTNKYEITEDFLLEYMHGYVRILGKETFKLKPSEYRYTRKLAGLTLMKHSIELGSSVHSIKAGVVYIIQNPAFEGFYKVGITTDLDKRLQTYQTYDPHRNFSVKRYEFVLDRRLVEKNILTDYKIELAKGEWCKSARCDKVFESATQTYPIILAP